MLSTRGMLGGGTLKLSSLGQLSSTGKWLGGKVAVWVSDPLVSAKMSSAVTDGSFMG